MSTSRLPAEDRRRQLLESALDLFSRKGYGGTTTKEVATAAGVTEAIIFRHFANKQALYTAVLDYRHESEEMLDWQARCKDHMERNDDPGLFRAILTKILKGYRKDPRLQRALFFAALEGHEQGVAYHRGLAVPIYESIYHYIQRRQREGALAPYDAGATLVAVAGMAAYYALMTELFGFPAPIPDDQAIEVFTNILLTGVQPPAAPEAKI